MTQGAELANSEESRWSTLLGQHMNQAVINLSQGGVSNATIVRTTVDYLLQTGNHIEHVIIGWTNSDRKELSLCTGDWLYLTPQTHFVGDQDLQGNPPESYREKLYHDWYRWHANAYNSVTETLRNIMAVNAVCKHLGIKITNFFAMPDTVFQFCTDPEELKRVAQRWYRCFPLEDLNHRDPAIYIESQQNLQRMLDHLPRDSWFLWGSNLVDACRYFPHGPGLHPLEQAQEFFAKQLYDHIRQR